MEKANGAKILRIRNEVPFSAIRKESSPDEVSRSVAEQMAANAKNVLDDTESVWEMEHGAVEVRDKLHLLRYYLDYLRRYFEGNV